VDTRIAPDVLKTLPRPQFIREQLARHLREVELLKRLLTVSELVAKGLAPDRERRGTEGEVASERQSNARLPSDQEAYSCR
jgi:hypothetical protein